MLNEEQSPQNYPKRILLAVTGLSPQVLTETLYALAVMADMPFIPHECHLITTQEGAEYARHTLLPDGMGRMGELLRDYGLEGRVKFDADSIHVITDEQGTPIPDIQTPEDTARAADGITRLVRQFTQDENTALHVSIAGGRKSMGFFMGYALSLYGRKQDRLSHVLVNAPFESNHEFYYPPRSPKVLYDRNNKPIRTSDARIVLADIPFIRLRSHLPDGALQTVSFSQAIRQAQHRFEPPELTLDPSARQLYCAGERVVMEPTVFAYYWWIAAQSVEAKQGVQIDTPAAAETYLHYYAQVQQDPMSGRVENARAALEKRIASPRSSRPSAIREYFDPHKSKANKALLTALGPLAAKPYLVCLDGQRVRPRAHIGQVDGPLPIIRVVPSRPGT